MVQVSGCRTFMVQDSGCWVFMVQVPGCRVQSLGWVERFPGGLVFKAHRLVYHSALGLRVIKKRRSTLTNPRRVAGCNSCAPTGEFIDYKTSMPTY